MYPPPSLGFISTCVSSLPGWKMDQNGTEGVGNRYNKRQLSNIETFSFVRHLKRQPTNWLAGKSSTLSNLAFQTG